MTAATVRASTAGVGIDRERRSMTATNRAGTAQGGAGMKEGAA